MVLGPVDQVEFREGRCRRKPVYYLTECDLSKLSVKYIKDSLRQCLEMTRCQPFWRQRRGDPGLYQGFSQDRILSSCPHSGRIIYRRADEIEYYDKLAKKMQVAFGEMYIFRYTSGKQGARQTDM